MCAVSVLALATANSMTRLQENCFGPSPSLKDFVLAKGSKIQKRHHFLL